MKYLLLKFLAYAASLCWRTLQIAWEYPTTRLCFVYTFVLERDKSVGEEDTRPGNAVTELMSPMNALVVPSILHLRSLFWTSASDRALERLAAWKKETDTFERVWKTARFCSLSRPIRLSMPFVKLIAILASRQSINYPHNSITTDTRRCDNCDVESGWIDCYINLYTTFCVREFESVCTSTLTHSRLIIWRKF